MISSRLKSKKQFLDGIFGGHSSNVSTSLGGQRHGGLNDNKDLLAELMDGEDSDEDVDFNIEMFKPNLRENENEFDYDLGIEEDKPKKKKKKKKVSSVKIEPVVSNAEAYGEAPHPNLLRPPYSMLIVAPKGSGKTTVQINWEKFYEDTFDNRIAFSPTLTIDDNWKAAFTTGVVKPYKKSNVFSRYNDAKLNKIWKAIKKENKGKDNYNDKLKTSFLFDDIVGQLPRNRDNACYKIARNHRHYGASHTMIGQEYCAFAPVLRKNATGIILFGTTDGAEIKTITEQQGGFIGKNRFFRMWAHCISQPYGFLFINKDIKEKHRYFCYFTDELNPLDFSNERVKDMIEEIENALGKGGQNDNANSGGKIIEEEKEDVEEEEEKPKPKRKRKKREITDKKLQEGNDTIEKNGKQVVPDIKDSQLHICKCRMKVIKDIQNVCNNGLNLICNAMGIDVEGMSKEEMLEELEGFKTSKLKKVLIREKKRLGQKDMN